MKKLLSIFVLFANFAHAQTPVYGKQNFKDSLQFSKYKNNLAGDSVLTVDVLGRVKLKVGSGSNSLTSTYIALGNSLNAISGSPDLSMDYTKSNFKAGVSAGNNSTGIYNSFIGSHAGEGSTGSHTINLGFYAGATATGNGSIYIGLRAGYANAFDNVALFGPNATASAPQQIVFNNSVANAQHDYALLTSDQRFIYRNQSGVVAFLSDIAGGAAYVFAPPLTQTGNIIGVDTVKHNAGVATYSDNQAAVAQGNANAIAIQQRMDSLQLIGQDIYARKGNVFVKQLTLPTSSTQVLDVTYSATSNQTDFTTPSTITDIKRIQVFRNGVENQITQISSTTIRLPRSADASDRIKIIQFN